VSDRRRLFLIAFIVTALYLFASSVLLGLEGLYAELEDAERSARREATSPAETGSRLSVVLWRFLYQSSSSDEAAAQLAATRTLEKDLGALEPALEGLREQGTIFTRALWLLGRAEETLRQYSPGEAPGVRTLQREARDLVQQIAYLPPDVGQSRPGPLARALPFSLPRGYELIFAFAGMLLAGALLIFVLIVELQRSQQLIGAARQAEGEARRATGSRARLLAVMSHEIRSALNGLLGMLELGREEPNRRQRDQYLETARQSGDNLLYLVNNILDFSKLEAGKMSLSKSPIDVARAVESVTTLLSPIADNKGLELICKVPSPRLPLLVGDELRLRQVLLNLVGNAVKFTARGAVVVHLAAREREGSIRQPLRIDVIDTGPGIAPDQRRRLFRDYEQASSAAPGLPGTGLGLSISRMLVELMGGRIEVESELGVGSRFSVLLELPDIEEQPVRHGMHGSGRIHLVVPSPLVADTVASYCRSAGYTTERFANLGEVAATLRMAAAAPDMLIIAPPWTETALADLEAACSGRAVRLGIVATHGQLRTLPRLPEGAAIIPQPVTLDAIEAFLKAEPGALAVVGAELPEEETAPVAERPAAPAPRQQGLILVAEDSDTNAFLLDSLLGREGYRTVRARDGLEAVTIASRGEVDLVLMDVSMPRMDGLEATRQIRAIPTAPGNVPIIALTAHAQSGDADVCLAAGMNDYIEKPIDRTRLFAAVAQWARRPAEPPPAEPQTPPPTGRQSTAQPAPAPDTRRPIVFRHDRPLVEPDTLARLDEDLGRDTLLRLIEAIAQECRDRLEDAKRAQQSGDIAALRAQLRDLGNVSASIGLARTQAITRSLDEALANGVLGDGAMVPQRIAPLLSTLEKTLSESIDLLPKREDLGRRPS